MELKDVMEIVGKASVPRLKVVKTYGRCFCFVPEIVSSLEGLEGPWVLKKAIGLRKAQDLACRLGSAFAWSSLSRLLEALDKEDRFDMSKKYRSKLVKEGLVYKIILDSWPNLFYKDVHRKLLMAEMGAPMCLSRSFTRYS